MCAEPRLKSFGKSFPNFEESDPDGASIGSYGNRMAVLEGRVKCSALDAVCCW